MQIFEFQFNPQKKNCQVETMLCEIKNNFRSLYLVGEMKNILPGNEKFLFKIMKMIKDNYSLFNKQSPEEALKNSLVKLNEYLSIEVARNNVSWLGNIHLAVISVSGNKVSIAKIGDIEIFLIEYGKLKKLDEKIKDDKSLNGQDFRSKTFGTVISGRLGKGEKISVITQAVREIFKKEKVLEKISGLPFLDKNLMEKMMDSIKKELLNLSGVFFLLDSNQPQRKSLFSENEIDFSLNEVILSYKAMIRKFFLNKKKIPLSPPRLGKIKMSKEMRRGLMLFILLILTLIVGFFTLR